MTAKPEPMWECPDCNLLLYSWEVHEREGGGKP